MSHRSTSSLEAPRLSSEQAETLLAAEPHLTVSPRIQWNRAVERHIAKLIDEGVPPIDAVDMAVEAEATARLVRHGIVALPGRRACLNALMKIRLRPPSLMPSRFNPRDSPRPAFLGGFQGNDQ
jgi:hypothetical protein